MLNNNAVSLPAKFGRDGMVRPELLLPLRQRRFYHDGGPEPRPQVQYLLGCGRRPETRAGRAAWPGRLLLMS